jgi:membrane protease YdiL (CAAX protease family)
MSALRSKNVTALIPYITILFGLNILKNAWVAILLYHAAILIVLMRNNNRWHFKRLLRGWNWRIGIPLSIASISSGLVLYYVWPLVSIDGSELSVILGDYGLSGSSWIIFMIYYCIGTPILEEVFWRGYLLTPGRYPSGPDILFAGYHILVLILFLKPLPIIAVFLSLVIVAWIWRMVAIKLNGLAIPFVSHLVAGIGVIWFVNLITRG